MCQSVNKFCENVLFLVWAIAVAVGLTCSQSVDAYYISGEGLESYNTLGRFLIRMIRCLSTDWLIPALVAALLFFLLVKQKQLECMLNDKIAAAVLALGFSVMQMLGSTYRENGNWNMLFATDFLLFRTLLCLGGMVTLFYCLLLFVFRALDRETVRTAEGTKMFDQKKFLLTAGIILLCWLPYFIYFYPGTSMTDTATQISQFFGQSTWTRSKSAVRGKDIILSNHFPFFTTVLYGMFLKIGRLLGNTSYGVALHTLLQTTFMAVTFTGVWFYLRFIGLAEKWVTRGILFTAVFPLYPMWAICMVKDTGFGMLTLLMSVLLCEIVRTKAAVLEKKFFCIGLFAVNCLFILFRSQGVYIMILVSVLFLSVYRKKWLRVALTLLVPILLFQMVWIKILLPAWKVAPGGKQEMLGVLFQQTARYVRDHGEEVTEEEAEAIRKVIDYDALIETYNPEKADPVKFTYNQDCTAEELADYLKVWLGMFLKHPGCYIQAVLNNSYGFYYMQRETNLYYVGYFVKDRWKGSDLYIENKFASQEEKEFVSSMQNILRNVPVIGIFFSPAFYAWIVLFYYVNMIRRKDYWNLLTGFILLISVGILFICPANGNIRYQLPMLFSAPFLVGLCLCGPVKMVYKKGEK